MERLSMGSDEWPKGSVLVSEALYEKLERENRELKKQVEELERQLAEKGK